MDTKYLSLRFHVALLLQYVADHNNSPRCVFIISFFLSPCKEMRSRAATSPPFREDEHPLRGGSILESRECSEKSLEGIFKAHPQTQADACRKIRSVSSLRLFSDQTALRSILPLIIDRPLARDGEIFTFAVRFSRRQSSRRLALKSERCFSPEDFNPSREQDSSRIRPLVAAVPARRSDPGGSGHRRRPLGRVSRFSDE